MEIKTVNTILYCNKWDETIDFYKNKLRFEVTVSLDWFVEFKLNECAWLSIANDKRASVKSSGGKGLTITMRVESIHKTFSFLKEAGVNPTAIKDHAWGAKVVHVFDPEGNRIEFWSQG